MNPISRCLCPTRSETSDRQGNSLRNQQKPGKSQQEANKIQQKSSKKSTKSNKNPTKDHKRPKKKPPHQPVRRPQYHQIILSLPDSPANYSNILQPASSSASFSSAASLSAFSADLIVTVVSVKVMFLDFSNMAFMSLPATGAQVPFSMIAMVRF